MAPRPAKPFRVSFEFFPPKTADMEDSLWRAIQRLAPLAPDFVSVTYGAGGGTQAFTLEIVTRLKRDYGLEPMAHLTCVGASEATIQGFLASLCEAGIDNVLALRGDPPKGVDTFVPDSEAFQHATDLVAFIRERFPRLGVGVAGYPEKHPEAPSLDEDLNFLKLKQDVGGQFVTTQLFFDNDKYFEFVEKARARGVTAPILPGVMPVLSLASILRMSTMCGASIPPAFLASLEQADAQGGGEAVQLVGVEYARQQVRDLLRRGAPGVHLYTLNKAEACLDILADLDVCTRLGCCR